MKTLLFAAALLVGGVAMAQTETTTKMQPASPTSSVVMPDNIARVDSAGVPVISAPAQAPAGFNQAPGMNGVGGPYVDPSRPPAAQPATIDYPLCSRTVTDHCVENYDQGGPRPFRRHRRHR